jgi:hypothetical protein
MVARSWFTELTSPVVWGAVVAGVFIALVVHILLNMLGAGIGAVSMDVGTPTEGEAQAVGWGAFTWWSISGIIAAFAGGWAAGVLAAAAGSRNGALHGFLSWAVTTVLVVTGAAVASGTAAAAIGAMFAPLPTFTERPQEISEAAQTAIAVFSLVSLVALLIGAVAATWGGRLASARTTEPRPARK